MGRVRHWLVALLAAALLTSMIFAFVNRRILLSKIHANEHTCTLSRLDFPPVGPQIFLPAVGTPDRVLQTFFSHNTVLSGVEIGLIAMPNAPEVSGTLTLFDARGAEMRTERFTAKGFSARVLRIRFKPVAHTSGAGFSFSLNVDSAVAGLVAAQGSQPTEYSEGSLFINGEKQPFSLFHRTVHPTRWQVRNLVAILDHVKLPYFLGVALCGLLAFGFLSYRAVYLVVLLTSLYTAFAFMPYSQTDEDGHFDYVNQLYNHRELPLMTQKYSLDELDALAGEIGNPMWSSSIWFGTRHVAGHPPLYHAVGAALAALAGLFTDSIAVRFYALRLLGVLFLAGTAPLIARTYELLITRSVIARNDVLFFTIVAVFLLSPGFQTILVPVTNEQLTVPLVSLQFYLVARIWLQDKPAILDLILLSSCTGLLLLTKTTTWHVVPLVVIFLLSKRVYLGIAGYLVCALLFVLPWLAFNQHHYGTPLAIKLNLSIASKSLGMASPLNLGALLSATDRFVQNYLLSYDRTFLFSQKGGFVILLSVAWKCLMWSVVISYGWILVELWTRGRQEKTTPALPADLQWGLFCLLGIGLHYVMLVGGWWRYDYSPFDPRYSYMNVLAAVFCIYVLAQRAGGRIRSLYKMRGGCRRPC